MPDGLFADPTSLPIVEPAADAPVEVCALFDMIRKGSVAVAVPLDDGTERVAVYYEGGLFTRPPEVDPTPDNLVEYAKAAAGRAAQHYPTVARFVLQDATRLAEVGRVNIQTWEVEFFNR